MTDTELLNKIIEDSGLKKKFIAEKLGIKQYNLANKISGKTEFKGSEIALLSNILKLTPSQVNKVFFNLS